MLSLDDRPAIEKLVNRYKTVGNFCFYRPARNSNSSKTLNTHCQRKNRVGKVEDGVALLTSGLKQAANNTDVQQTVRKFVMTSACALHAHAPKEPSRTSRAMDNFERKLRAAEYAAVDNVDRKLPAAGSTAADTKQTSSKCDKCQVNSFYLPAQTALFKLQDDIIAACRLQAPSLMPSCSAAQTHEPWMCSKCGVSGALLSTLFAYFEADFQLLHPQAAALSLQQEVHGENPGSPVLLATQDGTLKHQPIVISEHQQTITPQLQDLGSRQCDGQPDGQPRFSFLPGMQAGTLQHQSIPDPQIQGGGVQQQEQSDPQTNFSEPPAMRSGDQYQESIACPAQTFFFQEKSDTALQGQSGEFPQRGQVARELDSAAPPDTLDSDHCHVQIARPAQADYFRPQPGSIALTEGDDLAQYQAQHGQHSDFLPFLGTQSDEQCQQSVGSSVPQGGCNQRQQEQIWGQSQSTGLLEPQSGEAPQQLAAFAGSWGSDWQKSQPQPAWDFELMSLSQWQSVEVQEQPSAVSQSEGGGVQYYQKHSRGQFEQSAWPESPSDLHHVSCAFPGFDAGSSEHLPQLSSPTAGPPSSSSLFSTLEPCSSVVDAASHPEHSTDQDMEVLVRGQSSPLDEVDGADPPSPFIFVE